MACQLEPEDVGCRNEEGTEPRDTQTSTAILRRGQRMTVKAKQEKTKQEVRREPLVVMYRSQSRSTLWPSGATPQKYTAVTRSTMLLGLIAERETPEW